MIRLWDLAEQDCRMHYFGERHQVLRDEFKNLFKKSCWCFQSSLNRKRELGLESTTRPTPWSTIKWFTMQSLNLSWSEIWLFFLLVLKIPVALWNKGLKMAVNLWEWQITLERETRKVRKMYRQWWWRWKLTSYIIN